MELRKRLIIDIDQSGDRYRMTYQYQQQGPDLYEWQEIGSGWLIGIHASDREAVADICSDIFAE